MMLASKSSPIRSSYDVEVGEQTPLLNKTTKQHSPEPLKEIAAFTLKEKAVAGISIVGFVTSVLSILVEASGHPIVYITGMLGIILSPYAAFQQRKLTEVEAMRETNERMQEEVSKLQEENNRLSSNVQNMQESVSNLKTLKETLDQLSTLQADSVDQIEKQVKESEKILESMQTNHRGKMLSNLISILTAIDTDHNMLLSDEEIDELIQTLEDIENVDFKEEKVRDFIVHEQGRRVVGLLEVSRHILSDDPDGKDKLFTFIKEEKKKEEKKKEEKKKEEKKKK